MRTLCVAVCACAVLCASAGGQAAAAPASGSPMDSYTLHVSSSMLQLPVLVTDKYNDPVTWLDTSRFRIQFENGVTVVPKLVRPEGNDPVTLGILMDGRLALPLLDSLPDAMASMAKKQLRPADRVAVWATDGCHLRRLSDLEAPDAERLHDHAAKALTYKPVHGGGAECSGPRNLWDAMVYGVSALAGEPGRRVLLVITSGDDLGSNFSANQMAERAVAAGVAVFAITPQTGGSGAWNPSTMPPFGSHGGLPQSMQPVQTASYIASVTAKNGGMVLESGARSMPLTMEHFMQLVRARYIMEFARPANLAPGNNMFHVLLGASPDYRVTTAGTSMPMPQSADPALEHGTLQKATAPATNP